MLYDKNLRGIRKKVDTIDDGGVGSYVRSIDVAEGGTTFMVTASGAYTIKLPLMADAGAGWHCSFITGESAATLGGIITIQNNEATTTDKMSISYHEANDSMYDLLAVSIKFVATAKRGAKIDIFTDGNLWYASGWGSSAATFDKA